MTPTPSPTTLNNIDRAFADCRAAGRAAAIFYVTAGYPDLATSEAAVDWAADEGADIVELGIPFSDPIADGPTIQNASARALAAGTRIADILELTRRLRERHPRLGLLLFTAYNPVFRFGEAAFVEAAVRAGADGLLIPDLPPEEAGELPALAARAGLSQVFLIAPTTSEDRAARLAEASTGFIYYISLKGVTGARAELPPDLEPNVRRVRAATDKPVAVGFGVSRPEQARAISGFADGVIVGSALIKAIGEEPDDPEREMRVRAFVRGIVEATRS